MKLAHYAPLRLHPYAWRSEHLNIGLVVRGADGAVRIHLADNLKKLRSFAPRVDLDVVRGWPAELQPMLSNSQSLDEVAARLARWGQTRQLGEQRGAFQYNSEETYALRVAAALERLVEPEARLRTASQRGQRSRLEVELREAFSAYGWLAPDPSQVDHRIVPRYPIDLEADLRADFAVRNGVMHVIETVDFRVAEPASKRDSARAKALVLTLAQGARKYAVVAGGDGEESQPSVRLLQRQSDVLVRWESPESVDRFLAEMARITGRPIIGLPTTT